MNISDDFSFFVDLYCLLKACTVFCILLFGYLQAILEVGEVLQFYVAHRRFPAWGFGARPIDGPVSHCFNLNGSTYQPEVLQQPEL